MRWKAAPEGLLAPSPFSSSGSALKLPGASSSRAVDDHLVQPETREEIVRGERIQAQPARAPHADQHFGLDYVLGAHVAPGFIGATDLLTRAGPDSDFATDTCIRRAGTDPETDGRHLEELAFEVVNEQSLKSITDRAEDLTRRGVRRVFAIFVKKGTVKEWAPRTSEWRALSPEVSLRDRCLSRPLAVRALLDAAAADDEVARALEAKGNPAILAMKTASAAHAAQREAAAAVLSVLAARGLEVPARVRAAIEDADQAELRCWLTRAITAASAADVVGAG
jgi:hypothetical protein